MLTISEPAVSLAGLEPGAEAPWAGGPRSAIAWAAAAGFPAVQLDATAAGIRPRDLDRSARRDLASILRRSGLALSGLDLWIPPAHFADSTRLDRATEATVSAIALAAELADLVGSGRLVSLELPDKLPALVRTTLEHAAHDASVVLADHRPGALGNEALAVGLDPAAALAAGTDPALVAASGVSTCRLSDLSSAGRVPLGRGRVDVTALAVALLAGSSSAAVIVDLRGLRDQDAGAQEARRTWRSVQPSAM